MIFDRVPIDRVPVGSYVPLGPQLPEGYRRMTASPGRGCQAEKRETSTFDVSTRVHRAAVSYLVPQTLLLEADGRSHRPAESGQYAQRRDVGLLMGDFKTVPKDVLPPFECFY